MAIEKMSGSVEGFHPVGGREMGLEKEGADDVIDGAQDTLGFAILGRGVRARHAEGNTMGEKEGASGGVVELTAVVTFHAFDGGAELSGDKREKVCNSGEHVGFETEREGPQVVGAIVENSKIIFES